MSTVVNFFDYYKKTNAQTDSLALICRFDRPSIFDFLQTLPHDANFEDIELPDITYFSNESDKNLDVVDKQILESYLWQEAEDILPFVRRAVHSPNHSNLIEFYNRLTSNLRSHDMLFILVDLINEDDSIEMDKLRILALWLIKSSPDRLGVCTGLLLLGLANPRTSDKELLMLLGSHEAFTFFAFIVLMEIHPNEQHDYIAWELARKTHGKGRQFIIERLFGTRHNEIRHWLLCEGYKRAGSQPICALKCATKCGLVHALEAFEPDDKLLIAAAEILAVLMKPDDNGDVLMAFFIEGTKALSLLVKSLEDAFIKDISLFKNLMCIKFLLEDTKNDKWQNFERLGWTCDHRNQLAKDINAIARKQGWKQYVLRKLQFGDDAEFALATKAAAWMQLDTWPYYFERQRAMAQSHHWLVLFNTDNDQFFEAALLLAEKQILLPWLAKASRDNEWPVVIHELLNIILERLVFFPQRGKKWLDLALSAGDQQYHYRAAHILAKWKSLTTDTQHFGSNT